MGAHRQTRRRTREVHAMHNRITWSMARGIIPGMVNEGIPTPAQIKAMSAQDYKVAENRLRRAAERQGLRLEKSRLRDPRAIGYGTYQLVEERSGATVAQADPERAYGLDLCEIARYLYGDRDGR